MTYKPTVAITDHRTGDVTQPPARDGQVEVSVVIPCLDEADTIEQCVRHARRVLERNQLSGEVVVADNGSRDDSAMLARAAGARVVDEPRRGYGAACRAGLAAAGGRFIVIADADLTYDFAEIPNFLRELHAGADLVVGDRLDNVAPGAMPWLHRYVGNPALSGLLNLLFKTGVRDAHCGMRALRRDALDRLQLRTTGMEFASEMVIRARKERLQIAQIAIGYDRRGGTSKLSRWSDGWRHLRYLLVHSPTHLFLWPGALLAVLGALIAAVALSDVEVLGRRWHTHAMVGGSLLMILGVQVLSLGLCAKAYATYVMGERDKWFERMSGRFRLEQGLLLGAATALVGLVLGAIVVARWAANDFGELALERTMILASSLVVIGAQVVFSSFLLSIIGLRRGAAR